MMTFVFAAAKVSAETITAYATVGMFLLALIAVVVALRQIHVMKEVEAYNAYENYHHFILQYPELGAGGFVYNTASTQERFRYITFVMSVLLTLERVMALFRNEPDWNAAFEDDLVIHREFLCSPDFGTYIGNLNPRVAQFIQKTAIKLRWDYPYMNWQRPKS